MYIVAGRGDQLPPRLLELLHSPELAGLTIRCVGDLRVVVTRSYLSCMPAILASFGPSPLTVIEDSPEETIFVFSFGSLTLVAADELSEQLDELVVLRSDSVDIGVLIGVQPRYAFAVDCIEVCVGPERPCAVQSLTSVLRWSTRSSKAQLEACIQGLMVKNLFVESPMWTELLDLLPPGPASTTPFDIDIRLNAVDMLFLYQLVGDPNLAAALFVGSAEGQWLGDFTEVTLRHISGHLARGDLPFMPNTASLADALLDHNFATIAQEKELDLRITRSDSLKHIISLSSRWLEITLDKDATLYAKMLLDRLPTRLRIPQVSERKVEWDGVFVAMQSDLPGSDFEPDTTSGELAFYFRDYLMSSRRDCEIDFLSVPLCRRLVRSG